MGIQNWKQVLDVLDAIELFHLVGIVIKIVCQQVASDPSNMRRPWIVKSAGVIFSIAQIFAPHGVDVMVATDGKTQFHTKRASFQRDTGREHAWI